MSTTSDRLTTAIRVVAFVLSLACAQTPRAGSDGRSPATSLRAEIEGINRQLEDAFNRKDMAAVARYYTDDARIVGPRGQEIRGRAAIDAYWRNLRMSVVDFVVIWKRGSDGQLRMALDFYH